MTTVDPAYAVQNGLRDLFMSDPEIQQYVTGVLDEVPDVAARQYPFIVIPDLMSVPDGTHDDPGRRITRSEEHTSELQSLMRNSYDVFCLKKTKKIKTTT